MSPIRSRSSWKTKTATAVVTATIAIAGSLITLAAILIKRTPAAWANVPAREFTTAQRERAEIRLSDATRVILGPDSRLRVPLGFGDSSRAVYLEGEGYFEVPCDSSTRFTIYAGRGVVQNSGASFGVRVSPDGKQVQVVAVDGSLQLRSAKPSVNATISNVVLSRGQLGQLLPSGGIAVLNHVDVQRYVAWTKGNLAFNKTPLYDTLSGVEGRRDLNTLVANSALADPQLTAIRTARSPESTGA